MKIKLSLLYLFLASSCGRVSFEETRDAGSIIVEDVGIDGSIPDVHTYQPTPTELLNYSYITTSSEDITGLSVLKIHLCSDGSFKAVRKFLKTVKPVYGTRKYNHETTTPFNGEWFIDDNNPNGVILQTINSSKTLPFYLDSNNQIVHINNATGVSVQIQKFQCNE